MKYLKYYESFYSPAEKVFKSNIGSDEINDTGANTYPMDSFVVDDEQKAFDKGKKAFEDGVDIEENPYLDQQYQNSTLVKAWIRGWYNGHRNKKLKNEAMVDFTGNIMYPEYLSYDEEDNPDAAYQKGRDAAENDCDEKENPYISTDEEENKYIEELRVAWWQGWEDYFNSPDKY